MKSSTCQDIQSLVPGYMDGELSEEQAGPLRKHLLSCQACRGLAQDMGNLSHWFVKPDELSVPGDFAARVARAAFAGESSAATALAGQDESKGLPARAAEDPGLRSFVLGLTSIAATLLLCLALFMAQREEPQGEELSAEPIPAALQELDRLNATESLQRSKESPSSQAKEAVALPTR